LYFIYIIYQKMRGKKAPKRHLEIDEVYNSLTVSKFVNYVMLDGKREIARSIVHAALEELGAKTKNPPVVALEQALANAKPKIEVRSRRVGGSNFQVPTPVPEHRQLGLAFKWLIAAARKARKTTEFSKVLAKELIDAFNGEGNAVRKKEDVQKMAEANRAFAQFSW
jgi:small subunit ribosomal protein S7